MTSKMPPEFERAYAEAYPDMLPAYVADKTAGREGDREMIRSDVSMCPSTECPVAPRCTRSTLGGRKPHPTRQVWSQFEPGNGTGCWGWSPKAEDTTE